MDIMMSRRFLPLCICLLLGALLSVVLGQDATWDLENYHLYNAWAFLHQRFGIDLAVASLQSFFNPLPDLPYFWLGNGPLHDFPRLLAAYQGLWYGALSFILYRIAVCFATQCGRAFGSGDIAAIFIGITSTMAASQAGLSTNEVPVACFILGGFLAIMPLALSPPPTRIRSRAAACGLLCGFAAGLKPTAIVYVPALAAALWITLGMRAQAWRVMMLFCMLSGLGFIASYGVWGWQLWQLTGNPIFPMFNQIFHSNWAPASSATDRRFMPHGILQNIFYPFWWIFKNQSLVTEIKFSDARYACAMLAMLSWPFLAPWRSEQTTTEKHAVRMLFVFVGVSYVLWLGLYSILRYTVPISVLTGLIITITVQTVIDRFVDPLHRRRFFAWSMMVIALILASVTHYPNWGHTHYKNHAFPVASAQVDPGSLVLIISQPNAFVVPFIPHAEEDRFLGLTWLNDNTRGFELDNRALSMIRAHHGPIFAVLRDDDDGGSIQRVKRYIPEARLDDCLPIQSALNHRYDAKIKICRVHG